MNDFDDAVRDMLRARANRGDAAGLLDATLGAVSTTPQLHRLKPQAVKFSTLTGLVAAGLVLALVIGWTAIQPGSPLGVGRPGGSPAASSVATVTSSVAPSDVQLTPPPYVAGSCPVTPPSVLVGGVDPAVVVSGVRWLWGGLPWLAGVGQKVIVQPATANALQTTEILATRLSIGSAISPANAVYPNTGNSEVYGVGLPFPGCWLLTLIGPEARSSVVVSAGPAPSNPDNPALENVPTATTQPRFPATCPVTQPQRSTTVRTWFDDAIRWQDPDPTTWVPGNTRRLVVAGTGTNQPFERLVAVPVVTIASTAAMFVPAGDISANVTPDGSDKSAAISLPKSGCWAISYLDPRTTSSIVVQIP